MLNKLVTQERTTIERIIDLVKVESRSIDGFCLYTPGYAESLRADMVCYLDTYPEGDDDGEDVFPPFVLKSGLDYAYSGEQFADVIENVLHQKPTASVSDFLEALNFYRKNDNFMDF